MMDMQTQVKNLGGEIKNGIVLQIKPTPNPHHGGQASPEKGGAFEIFLEGGEKLITKAVIVATGAGAKWLGIPREKELIGHGVSGCATCDGMFFRGKTVAVVGGGDVACEDAGFLTKFAEKVYLIHRRDQLRAQVPQQKLVINNPKIEFFIKESLVPYYTEDNTNAFDDIREMSMYSNMQTETDNGFINGSMTCFHNPSLGVPDFIKTVHRWVNKTMG
jgi:thioredoxin reductase (NADPH)